MTRFIIVSLAVLALTFWMVGVATATPLVHYTFDEASSGATNAVNQGSLGSAGDGIFAGNATRTASTPGGYSTGAMDTPGNAGDYMATAGDLDGVDGLSTMTITGWVNFGSIGPYDRLAEKRGPAPPGAWDQGWAFLAPSGTSLEIDSVSGAAYGQGDSDAISAAGTWLFVGMTWDHTAAELKYYTGTEAGAVSQLGTTIDMTGWPVPGNHTNKMYIGTGYDGVTDRNPDMLLDDFRIYGSVLSSSDLETVRQSNLVPEPSAIVIFMTGLLGLLCYAWRKRK